MLKISLVGTGVLEMILTLLCLFSTAIYLSNFSRAPKAIISVLKIQLNDFMTMLETMLWLINLKHKCEMFYEFDQI